MAQITVRLDERLADEVKRHAALSGRSVNGFVVALLEAAIDPELEDEAAQRTRARLARAGLLAQPSGERPSPPGRRRLARARRAAGQGVPLSDLVADGRG